MQISLKTLLKYKKSIVFYKKNLDKTVSYRIKLTEQEAKELGLFIEKEEKKSVQNSMLDGVI